MNGFHSLTLLSVSLTLRLPVCCTLHGTSLPVTAGEMNKLFSSVMILDDSPQPRPQGLLGILFECREDPGDEVGFAHDKKTLSKVCTRHS